MAIIREFPPAFIALNQEMTQHPDLWKRIQKHHDIDPELQFSKALAEICAYCDIAIDGHFTEQQMIAIADLCVMRLRKMRAEIITTVETNSPSIVDISGNPIVKH